MEQLHEQSMQNRRGSEMVVRLVELRRAVRRGGAQGVVVHAGRRKNAEEDHAFFPKIRARYRNGPQTSRVSIKKSAADFCTRNLDFWGPFLYFSALGIDFF